MSWLAEHGAVAVLVRPDFAIFGIAAGPADISGLVDQYLAALGRPVPAETVLTVR